MPQADEKTEGGIVKASQTIKDEEVSNICGYVLKLGPDCYKDEDSLVVLGANKAIGLFSCLLRHKNENVW